MGIFFPTSKPFDVGGNQVAIITRTKNRPVLLVRAFASVLSQTHTQWHLYLVNDGGDPEPVNRLVEQYEAAFNGRITVLHHEKSMGMEAASNAGLRVAQGDFVIIHDDDDSWQPKFLARTVAYLQKPEHARFAAVATNCTVIYERINGSEVIETSREPSRLFKDRVDMLDLLKLNNIPPICTLIRKPLVDLIGPYNDQLPVLGDWDYNLRILTIGDIGTIDEPLANYHHRVPEGGSSNYSNSVIGGKSKHLDYQVLYRNSMVRKLMQRDPAYAGLFHVMLWRFADTEERLGRIEQKLDWARWDINRRTPPPGSTDGATVFDEQFMRVISNIDTALRPVRWLWRRLYPLRRIIAKLRQRA